MAFVYQEADRASYTWLAPEAILFEFTEGTHVGKLVEVIAKQIPQDINQDNIVDYQVIQIESRRVDSAGNTILVGTSPIRLNSGSHTVMQAAIASGAIDPVAFVAEKTQETIEKLINLEATVGAFSFLPS